MFLSFFHDFFAGVWVVSKSFPDIMLGFSGKKRLGALETSFWGRGFSKCWFLAPSGARNQHLGAWRRLWIQKGNFSSMFCYFSVFFGQIGWPWISRLLAQPPWMGFQAVIKSAASAASLGTQKIPKKSWKNDGKIALLGLYVYQQWCNKCWLQEQANKKLCLRQQTLSVQDTLLKAV